MTETNKELLKKEAEFEKGVERTRAKRVFIPSVDIVEKKDNIFLYADMPGVDENSVEITLEKNLLTIQGSVTPEEHENHKLVVSEYDIGDYERTFTLSNEIDREHISATVKDGVLTLTLPKADIAQTKKIRITGNA